MDAKLDGVEVPPAYVENGKIVLNVHTQAVETIELGNEMITFSARFGGVPYEVILQIHSVLAIVTRENEHGIIFQSDRSSDKLDETAEQIQTKSAKVTSETIRRPHLHLVE